MRALVAEVVISLAFVSQTPSVDPEHPHELRRARIECPETGRHQPRPVEDVAFAQGRNDQRLLTRRVQL